MVATYYGAGPSLPHEGSRRDRQRAQALRSCPSSMGATKQLENSWATKENPNSLHESQALLLKWDEASLELRGPLGVAMSPVREIRCPDGVTESPLEQ